MWRVLVLAAVCLTSCSFIRPAPSPPANVAKPRPVQVGKASWYGADFHGRRTASGARFDQNGLTAASRTLPLGSRARVTNVANGKSVVVEITDRGPFTRGRVIDVSRAAAHALGMIDDGTARVRIEPLPADGREASNTP